MNLKEYKKSHREIYKSLAAVVREILLAAINTNEYRLLQIQDREKSIDSLTKKLTIRKILDSKKIEKEIKDLAGCRIIFLP